MYKPFRPARKPRGLFGLPRRRQSRPLVWRLRPPASSSRPGQRLIIAAVHHVHIVSFDPSASGGHPAPPVSVMPGTVLQDRPCYLAPPALLFHQACRLKPFGRVAPALAPHLPLRSRWRAKRRPSVVKHARSAIPRRAPAVAPAPAFSGSGRTASGSPHARALFRSAQQATFPPAAPTPFPVAPHSLRARLRRLRSNPHTRLQSLPGARARRAARSAPGPRRVGGRIAPTPQPQPFSANLPPPRPSRSISRPRRTASIPSYPARTAVFGYISAPRRAAASAAASLLMSCQFLSNFATGGNDSKVFVFHFLTQDL